MKANYQVNPQPGRRPCMCRVRLVSLKYFRIESRLINYKMKATVAIFALVLICGVLGGPAGPVRLPLGNCVQDEVACKNCLKGIPTASVPPFSDCVSNPPGELLPRWGCHALKHCIGLHASTCVGSCVILGLPSLIGLSVLQET